jgi:hypothetical protein
MAGFMATETGNLTDVYVNVSAFQSGFIANTDGKIDGVVYVDSGGNYVPTTGSPAGTFQITLDGSTTGWASVSGLTISLTAGKLYFVSIGDADGASGGGTHYVTMKIGGNGSNSYPVFPGNACSTTDGWQTGSNQGASGAYIVVKQAGNWCALGALYETMSTDTSTALERGCRFRAPSACTLVGCHYGYDQNSLKSPAATWKLYADATAPNNTGLTSFAFPNQTGAGSAVHIPGTCIWPSANWYDLTINTWYRFIYSSATASTTPRLLRFNTTGTAPDANVLSVGLPFNGNCYKTIDNGSGGWTDSTDRQIHMYPILVPSDGGGIFVPNTIFTSVMYPIPY